MMKTFTGEPDKWMNKQNDKHEDSDSLLHNTTTSHTKYLYGITNS